MRGGTRRAFSAGLLCLCLCGGAASFPLLSLSWAGDDAAESAFERRERSLLRLLRCVVCDGQSLAESDAPLARDMRTFVRSLLEEGRSEAAIKDLMRQRYGESVVAEPLFSLKNALLWCGPFAFLASGLWCVWRALFSEERRSGGGGT